MPKSAHERAVFLRIAGLGSVGLQPFTKGGIERRVLRSSNEPSTLNQFIVGTQGDILHTKTVYTRFVHTVIPLTQSGSAPLIDSCLVSGGNERRSA